MITSFRFKDLRSVADSGRIDIRKVNVIVGKNSSGKSTVLRFLPLLRQSVEKATKGPILWYGRLVDFGSFSNATRDNDVDRGITFEFDMTVKLRQLLRRSVISSSVSSAALRDKSDLRLHVTAVLGSSSETGAGSVRVVTIKIGSDVIEIRFDTKGNIDSLTVLGRQVVLSSGKQWWCDPNTLFPSLNLFEMHSLGKGADGDKQYWDYASNPFLSETVTALRKIAHGRTSDENLRAIALRIPYAEPRAFYEHLCHLPGISDDFRYRISHFSAESNEIATLRRYILLSKISQITEVVGEELTGFANSIRYIEPLRAVAERYYRQQDLAVEDIDSRGANVPMFLGSLSYNEMLSLQEWMMSNLGFKVEVESDTGHVQIKISDENHGPRNIADLGFGYSQVLPIAIQVWLSTYSRDWHSPKAVLLAMEQPELHLHPDYQAKLADMMASAANASGEDSYFRIFVETHSDHFINRLGALVSEGKISAEDVNILVVKERVDGASVVEAVEFDGEGFLGLNWPVGFFTPGYH